MQSQTMLQKINYYRFMIEKEKEKEKEWLHEYNSLSEEKWYETSSDDLKSLVNRGVIPVLYSKKLKELVKNYK